MRSEMPTHGLRISEGILRLKLSVHFGTLLFNCVRKLNVEVKWKTIECTYYIPAQNMYSLSINFLKCFDPSLCHELACLSSSKFALHNVNPNSDITCLGRKVAN